MPRYMAHLDYTQVPYKINQLQLRFLLEQI